jgi:hypothetical protein
MFYKGPVYFILLFERSQILRYSILGSPDGEFDNLGKGKFRIQIWGRPKLWNPKLVRQAAEDPKFWRPSNLGI